MDGRERVVVVGGGIGGLTAALALRRAGFDVVVLEQAAELRAVGGAMQLWANGMRVMRQLGLADQVAATSAAVETQSFRSWRGAELFRLGVGELARRHGIDPPYMVRRGELLRTLADAVGAEALHLGRACVGFEQDEQQVTARVDGGETEPAAALVVADGIDSRLRAAIGVDTEPRFAGYQYLRALVRFDGLEPGLFSFTFGRGDRFGLSVLRDGWLYWFGVVVNRPGAADPRGSRAEALERFREFPAPIPSIIEATEERAISRTDIRDLKPLERWTAGRVTLLGDAAHATTPNLGRGAGEALEDGVVLAQVLAAAGSLEDALAVSRALRDYEGRRRPAASEVQSRAFKIGKIASFRSRPAIAVREQIMRRLVARGMSGGVAEEFEELGRQPASLEATLTAATV